MRTKMLIGVPLLLLAAVIEIVQPTCVLESDFGFKINCAFKKSGLFRVRNLGGLKAHASLGFSLGDELGFEQSLTNLDPSRRRSVSVKNGAPPNLVATTKQEKRGKQNRIMMRPVAPPASRPNQSAMDKLTSLHRRGSTTMQPIIVPGPALETPAFNRVPSVTMAKPMPMGVPPFRPIPPKEDTLKVLPLTSSTRKNYTPLRIPESKGPGLVYQSEIYPQSHNQVSKMVSQMTAIQFAQPLLKFTPAPIMFGAPKFYTLPTTVNPFVPMPASPAQSLTFIQPPAFKDIQTPKLYTQSVSIQTNPVSNFVDSVPHQVHDIANNYPAYNTKKVDDYNTITGYGDDITLKFNKEDINAKIAEIAKAGNISMEAVEAAISLRQQQLLSKYANIPVPTTTTTSTTTTTDRPVVFEPEPEILVASVPQKPQRIPTSGKVMNAPKEYYPVGYEKNFDDHFQSKVDLPDTSFHCGDQKYFPGLYGDESLGCMVIWPSHTASVYIQPSQAIYSIETATQFICGYVTKTILHPEPSTTTSTLNKVLDDVFHVCALTDDGLVMKSFLCPESTLFDQTILKCNWWFYVDCKNTRKLYDTNIPVSKSYQLMKALTFFSSYKKEMQDDGRPTNPEDVEGVKEAISILENQNMKPSQPNSGPNTLQIITPQPIIDERNNHKAEYSTEPSPVYRINRNIYNATYINHLLSNNTNFNTQESNTEYSLVNVDADLSFTEDSTPINSAINSSEREKKHRRRMTLRFSNTTSKSVAREPATTTSKPIEVTTSSIEIVKQEIHPIENLNGSPLETLTDQLDALKVVENPTPVRRFYRSSAEKVNDVDKEMAIVNNQKVQIVRPTSASRLVGKYSTQSAVIAKLDEAVLGRRNLRFKKEVVTIVTPKRQLKDQNIMNDQT